MRFTLFFAVAAAAAAVDTSLERRDDCELRVQPVMNGGFEYGRFRKHAVLHWDTQSNGDGARASRFRVGATVGGVALGRNLYPNKGDFCLVIFSNYEPTDVGKVVTISQPVCLGTLGRGYVPSFVFGYRYDTNIPTSNFISAPSFSVQVGNTTLYESNVCGKNSTTLSSTELCNTNGFWHANVIELPLFNVDDFGERNLTLTWNINESGSSMAGFMDNISLHVPVRH